MIIIKYYFARNYKFFNLFLSFILIPKRCRTKLNLSLNAQREPETSTLSRCPSADG